MSLEPATFVYQTVEGSKVRSLRTTNIVLKMTFDFCFLLWSYLIRQLLPCPILNTQIDRLIHNQLLDRNIALELLQEFVVKNAPCIG